MEFPSLYSGHEAGSMAPHRADRLASDARNLVRDWFRARCHKRDLLTLAYRVIPENLQSCNVTVLAPGRARRVVAIGNP